MSLNANVHESALNHLGCRLQRLVNSLLQTFNRLTMDFMWSATSAHNGVVKRGDTPLIGVL